MHESLGSNPEEAPQNDFAPLLAYILDKGDSWDKLLGDLGEVYVAELLYEFSKDPGPKQVNGLLEAVEEAEDETLSDLINQIMTREGHGLPGEYVAALDTIITDVKSWQPARNAGAIRLAYEIEAWGLVESINTIKGTIEQFHDDEQAQWVPVMVQIKAFHKNMSQHGQLDIRSLIESLDIDVADFESNRKE